MTAIERLRAFAAADPATLARTSRVLPCPPRHLPARLTEADARASQAEIRLLLAQHDRRAVAA